MESTKSRWFLRVANSLLNVIVLLFLSLACLYAVYALWDNHRIHAAAKNVQADLMKMKPGINDGASFEELLAINPDVCAWVTLEGTEIDHPVVQGETNLTYINKDVYGEFALAGSIFLDSRNDRTFHDSYSLLYGHHMENSGMFGDLELYKKKSFFNKNTTGTLILPDRAYNLEIFACLVTNASDDHIFEVEHWQTDIDGLITYAEENAKYLRKECIENLNMREQPQVLALSTCDSDFTDARTIILAVMEPYQTADREEK